MSNVENVYWIGGSPCSGKSSISQILGEQFGIPIYHIDDRLPRHLQELNSEQYPALSSWLAASCNERWLKPVDLMVDEAMACYGEQWSLLADEIAAFAERDCLLVEGTALLPQLITQRINRPNQAIWIVPAAAFQREYYAKRAWVKDILQECSDPAAAFNNWMLRDSKYACRIREQAVRFGYRVLVVDGSQSLATNAEIVARHFGWIS